MVKFIRQSAKWAKKRFSEFPDRQLLIADCFSGKIVENADWRIEKNPGKMAPVGKYVNLEESRMERLTKQEKDTEIFYDQSNAPMQIRTHDLNLIRRLTALSAEYPDVCQLVETDPISGSFFEVLDKNRVSIHVTKPYSAERRRKQSEWAKEHGMKGNCTAKGQNVHLR